MSEDESASLPCGICHLPFQRLNGSHNLRICLTCSAIFQLNVKPSVRRSLELLRTITVEGTGFVEIDGGEFIVAGVSGLGYRFSVQTPFKMSIECYRTKDAALLASGLCLHPCVDLADESEEIPVGDLVFTYAMALTNDVHAAEEIETLEQCIDLRDSFPKPPTQEEWNEAVLKIRKQVQEWRFGGPFSDDEIEGWAEEDPPFFHEHEFEDEEEDVGMQNEENNHPIVPELPEWTQDRVERFLERIHRFSRND